LYKPRRVTLGSLRLEAFVLSNFALRSAAAAPGSGAAASDIGMLPVFMTFSPPLFPFVVFAFYDRGIYLLITSRVWETRWNTYQSSGLYCAQ
jgi:hypothetical protein